MTAGDRAAAEWGVEARRQVQLDLARLAHFAAIYARRVTR